MTEDLRALMRAELNNERPPPLGDVVGAALRDGRRIKRRRRRAGMAGAGAAGLIAVVLFGTVAAHSEPRRAVVADPAAAPALPSPASPAAMARAAQKVSPGSVPVTVSPPATVAPERSLTVHSGMERAAGPRKKATTGAMLHLLTQLLPPGRTSHAAVSGNEDPYVQIYLDRGDGPGMIRVVLGQLPEDPRPPRGGTATVSVLRGENNCVQDTVVVSRWPDGTAVQLDLASCLQDERPGRVVLTDDEATAIAADPRWGLSMDADLVDQGDKRYGGSPVFTS
ncbi:hypothetical protein JIG36_11605 [Actinoplanes sp. LDG1-06]|uniref:Uncharacterized protein n=1 Tax=Paractinoplanes ovalisporus TaxID=2810368 RepID=A0ABS2A8P7_9ACTN|nr:hypothetical protein [Actinoplanes ovalisporus]MBM2616202.1 hypothetical protein [Actinoplanes ovalisporus]